MNYGKIEMNDGLRREVRVGGVVDSDDVPAADWRILLIVLILVEERKGHVALIKS